MAQPITGTTLFEIFRGDDVGYVVNVQAADTEAPVDISGWTFRATLKLNLMADDSAAPVALDFGPLEGTEAEAGRFHLLLPHAQTKNLLPASYFFDLEREFDGYRTTVLAGRVRVHADVTRRSA